MSVTSFINYLLGKDATRELAMQLAEVHELRQPERRRFVSSAGTVGGR
jgi:hypothetical protein